VNARIGESGAYLHFHGYVAPGTLHLGKRLKNAKIGLNCLLMRAFSAQIGQSSHVDGLLALVIA